MSLDSESDYEDDIYIEDKETQNNTSSKILKKKIIRKVITDDELKKKFIDKAKNLINNKTSSVIKFKDIIYNNNNYTICCITFKNKEKLFVIDTDEKDKILHINWILNSNYMCVKLIIDGFMKLLTVHNIVMNKDFNWQVNAQTITVDHINRIRTDNRKCNLRLANYSQQNMNREKMDRTLELPKDCDISIDNIPKNVYYGKPNGAHGDFFYIEVKGIKNLGKDNKKYSWKSTKSKNVSLKVKLQQVVDKLKELAQTYTELQTVDSEFNREKSIEDYNNILKQSGFDQKIIDENIIDFKNELFDNVEINDDEQEKVDEVTIIKQNGRKKVSKLPENCGVTIDQVPKYVYYIVESEKRGDGFVIDKHPKLVEQGKRQWKTSDSKKISTLEKFNTLLEKIKELEDS